jgi:DNA-binding transcriptional LysR family regulator
MELSETGAELLEPARAMRDAAARFSVIAAGSGETLSGTVRITASMTASQYILPSIIADIRAAEPEIEIDLIASDAVENLLFREADIAVRMFRPEQLDVVTRHLGDVALGLFGAKSYLDRVGRPETMDHLMMLDFVGYESNSEMIDGFRAAGREVDRHFFRTRCDCHTVNWELMRAGCGLGFGVRSLGLADPTLEEVDLGLPIPSIPVWLTAHAALRQTPRIRRVWDLLTKGLEPVVS